MVQLVFNARSVAPDAGQLEPIPTGWYNTMIDESSMKPTTDGTGAYLQLRFTVLDGQFVGRKVFARLNLRNNSQQAQDIAFGQLSAICHAIGHLDMNDSAELHGKPLKIRVMLTPKRQKKDAQGNDIPGEFYEPSNDVKAYKNINDVVDMAAATAPQAQGGPAVSGAWNPGAPAPQPQQQFQPQAQHTQQFQPQAQQPQPQAQPQQYAAAPGFAPGQGQPGPAAYAPPAQAPAPQQQQPGAWVPPQGGQPWTPPQGAQPPAQAPAPAAPQQQFQPPANYAPGAQPPWGGPPAQ